MMKAFLVRSLRLPAKPDAGKWLNILALSVLCFSCGIIVAHFHLWPSGHFKRAYHGLLVLMEKKQEDRRYEVRGLWVEALRRDAAGVTRHARGRTWPGHTLYSSLHEAGAVLVDMNGREVHRWTMDEAALRKHLGLKPGHLTELAWFDQIRLLPDGGLWALVMTWDSVVNPAGLVRLSRESQVEWVYRARTHHDFDISADGTLYVLTHGEGRISLAKGVAAHIMGPVIMDYVDIVTPGGRRTRRISILDCLLNSEYRPWLEREEVVAPSLAGDVIHTNALRLVTHKDWALVPDNGRLHVLVSIRDLHLVGIIDLEAERFIHAVRGSFLLQHDPDLLPDGTIMLFDNWGNVGGVSRSRVVRFDPGSGRILWQWPRGGEEKLDSQFRGSQQMLPNGNVLITESHGGRIIEVTSGGDVVWEYYSPFRKGGRREYVPVIRWAQRVDAPWLKEREDRVH